MTLPSRILRVTAEGVRQAASAPGRLGRFAAGRAPWINPVLDRSRRWSDRYAGWCMLAIGLIVIPPLNLAGLINIETVNMLGRYMALAIVAVGLDLIWGYTGILGLCQAFFFSLGGYAMGMHLALHGPLDGELKNIPRALYVVSSDVAGFRLPWFWKPFDSLVLAVILGLLIPALVAGVIGFFGFASRVRGVYFAILTQAITFAAWLCFCRNDLRLCGTNGLTNFVVLAGQDLSLPSTKLGLYIVTLLALVAVYAACRRMLGARLGRILIAVRDNESRLRFSGYKPQHFKTFVFALSGMIAGLGGMLYAPQMGIFTPRHMEVSASILVVVWVAVGGRGTLSGAIVGALGVNLLYSVLTTRWPNAWPFVLGGLFIGVVLLFPNGVMSLWHRWTARAIDTSALTLASVEPEVAVPPAARAAGGG